MNYFKKFFKKINKTQVRVTESIILALFPLLGYLAAYGFEGGYLRFYGVDGEFIHITISSFILGALSILISLLFILLILQASYPFVLKFNPKNPIHRRVFASFLMLALWLWLYMLDDTKRIVWASSLLLVLVVFGILFLFIGPAFQFRKEKITYIERLRRVDENLNKTKNWSLIREIIFHKNFRLAVFIVLSIPILLTISTFWGNKVAAEKEKYSIYQNDSRNYVVISSFNGEKIAVEVDLDTKTLKNSYLIINPAANIELTLIKTGPLNNKVFMH